MDIVTLGILRRRLHIDMKYYTIEPSTRLSKFVKFFWVLESDGPFYIHRSMADVCVEMVFHYNGQFDELKNEGAEQASLTAVQGPSNRIRRFGINGRFGIFGVYFYPYALPLLFGIPSTELCNQMPDLFALLGAEGKMIEERIMLATSNQMRAEVMTWFLEQKLPADMRQHHPVLSAIHGIIQGGGQARIKELADEYFISERQFERKFTEYSGLSPKLFSRIVRFHSACRYFGQNSQSLSGVAHECGYYDQSHFIHDFKEFSGFHPKHYFSGMAEGTEWRS